MSGSLWIKKEDGLHLTVTWSGSHPYEYCYDIINGPYNSTGNETCDKWHNSTTPKLSISKLLFEEHPHTVLIIVRNQVTIIRKALGINTYEVKKQSQLSVIVVPVVFILSAIVVVIFGVARYVQTRNR